ncbi:hypothetical protein, partial [Burkholderia thailandensis]|uniref:hypothetical protein n=1 Tax=Burkholderia thailandensis TaxID=57975 RepID=UPI00217EF8E4
PMTRIDDESTAVRETSIWFSPYATRRRGVIVGRQRSLNRSMRRPMLFPGMRLFACSIFHAPRLRHNR